MVGATKSLGRQWPRERGSRGRRGSSRWVARGAGSSTWAGNGLVSEDHAAPRNALRGATDSGKLPGDATCPCGAVRPRRIVCLYRLCVNL